MRAIVLFLLMLPTLSAVAQDYWLPPGGAVPRRVYKAARVHAPSFDAKVRTADGEVPYGLRRTVQVDSISLWFEQPVPRWMRPKKRRVPLTSRRSTALDPVYRANHYEAAGSKMDEPSVSQVIEATSYLTNALMSGFFAIPPDPHAAAGPAHLITVVNTSIVWYEKTGVQLQGQSLRDFFDSVGPVGGLFDPRVIYDHFLDRFVVIVLEQEEDDGFGGQDLSYVLVAVSDDSDPQGSWTMHRISTKVDVGLSSYWADYPGLAVDEEAVYMTGNLFSFGPGDYGGSRVWILDKAPLYSGAAAVPIVFDPLTSGGFPEISGTLQPARVIPPAPAGNVGTWLTAYSGLNDGDNELLVTIRIDDPLGSPEASVEFFNLGDADNPGFVLPEAEQPDLGETIATNDRAMLDAVYRDGLLASAFTIAKQTEGGSERAGAYWTLNSVAQTGSGPPRLSLLDHGAVDASALGADISTFYPSLAVGSAGELVVGYSASGPSLYAGAYASTRSSDTPAGMLSAPLTIRAGDAAYYRTFGGRLNRWGDYTSVSWDPLDDGSFWVYGEYAGSRGNADAGEDGQWGTALGKVSWTTNTAPLALDGTAQGTEDEALLVVFDVSDEQADTWTIDVVSGPSSGTLNLTGQSATYLPFENFNGEDAIVYTATDGLLTSQAATVTITISPVNDAPEAAAQSLTAVSSRLLEITLSGNDEDEDELEFAIVSPPQSGSLTSTGPATWDYTSFTDFVGPDHFAFSVSDGALAAEAEVSIDVQPDPLVANPAATALAGGRWVVQDQDGDANDRFELFQEGSPLVLDLSEFFSGGTGPISYGPAAVADGFETVLNATLDLETNTLVVRVLSASRDGAEIPSESPIAVSWMAADQYGGTLSFEARVDPWPQPGDVDLTSTLDVYDAVQTLDWSLEFEGTQLSAKGVWAADFDQSATDGNRADGVTAMDAFLIFAALFLDL